MHTLSVNTNQQAKAGMNVFELMLLVAIVGITTGVALAVGKRFGLGWSILTAPVTLAAVFGLYSLFYWAVGFLPYPLGKPKRPKQQPKADDTDSSHVA
jgi:hypothetical protein